MNDILGDTDMLQQTPGQMLKAARETKKISINDVVQKLLLSKQIVGALEEDDYSKISAQVYAEGYLKSYAQFLQIPVDKLLANFRRLNLYSSTEVKTGGVPQVEGCLNFNCLLKKQYVRFILSGIVGMMVLTGLIFLIIKLLSAKDDVVETIPNASINLNEDTVNKEQLPVVITNDSELNIDKYNQSKSTEDIVKTAGDTLYHNVPTKSVKTLSDTKVN